jgi:hypothetical protein
MLHGLCYTLRSVPAVLLGVSAALLKGILPAAEHAPVLVRAVPHEVRYEPREAPRSELQGVLRNCERAVLGSLASGAGDSERVLQEAREVRCVHHVDHSAAGSL